MEVNWHNGVHVMRQKNYLWLIVALILQFSDLKQMLNCTLVMHLNILLAAYVKRVQNKIKYLALF